MELVVVSLEHKISSSCDSGKADSGFKYRFGFITTGFLVSVYFETKFKPEPGKFSEPAVFFSERTFNHRPGALFQKKKAA